MTCNIEVSGVHIDCTIIVHGFRSETDFEERASQEEQNGAFVALSSEGL